MSLITSSPDEAHACDDATAVTENRGAFISFHLTITDASLTLSQRWIKSDAEAWNIQLGPNLPTMKIVHIEKRDEDVMLMVEIPAHIHAKTMSWGYTQWCSSLIRPDMAPKTLIGIRYVDDKVRQEIRAVMCLLVIAPIFSLSQVVLIFFARGVRTVWFVILCVLVVVIEVAPYFMALWREFHVLFNIWQLIMCSNLLVKLGGCIYDFVRAVRTITSDHSSSNALAWANIGSIFASALAIFVSSSLLWLTRRLRNIMRFEDKMASILLSVERPKKFLSIKPFALWAVASTNTQRQRTISVRSARSSADI